MTEGKAKDWVTEAELKKRKAAEQEEAERLRKDNKMKFRVVDSRENGEVIDRGHLVVDINEKSKFVRKVNKYNNFLKKLIKGLENKEPIKMKVKTKISDLYMEMFCVENHFIKKLETPELLGLPALGSRRSQSTSNHGTRRDQILKNPKSRFNMKIRDSAAKAGSKQTFDGVSGLERLGNLVRKKPRVSATSMDRVTLNPNTSRLSASPNKKIRNIGMRIQNIFHKNLGLTGNSPSQDLISEPSEHRLKGFVDFSSENSEMGAKKILESEQFSRKEISQLMLRSQIDFNEEYTFEPPHQTLIRTRTEDLRNKNIFNIPSFETARVQRDKKTGMPEHFQDMMGRWKPTGGNESYRESPFGLENKMIAGEFGGERYPKTFSRQYLGNQSRFEIGTMEGLSNSFVKNNNEGSLEKKLKRASISPNKKSEKEPQLDKSMRLWANQIERLNESDGKKIKMLNALPNKPISRQGDLAKIESSDLGIFVGESSFGPVGTDDTGNNAVKKRFSFGNDQGLPNQMRQSSTETHVIKQNIENNLRKKASETQTDKKLTSIQNLEIAKIERRAKKEFSEKHEGSNSKTKPHQFLSNLRSDESLRQLREDKLTETENLKKSNTHHSTLTFGPKTGQSPKDNLEDSQNWIQAKIGNMQKPLKVSGSLQSSENLGRKVRKQKKKRGQESDSKKEAVSSEKRVKVVRQDRIKPMSGKMFQQIWGERENAETKDEKRKDNLSKFEKLISRESQMIYTDSLSSSKFQRNFSQNKSKIQEFGGFDKINTQNSPFAAFDDQKNDVIFNFNNVSNSFGNDESNMKRLISPIQDLAGKDNFFGKIGKALAVNQNEKNLNSKSRSKNNPKIDTESKKIDQKKEKRKKIEVKEDHKDFVKEIFEAKTDEIELKKSKERIRQSQAELGLLIKSDPTENQVEALQKFGHPLKKRQKIHTLQEIREHPVQEKGLNRSSEIYRSGHFGKPHIQPREAKSRILKSQFGTRKKNSFFEKEFNLIFPSESGEIRIKFENHSIFLESKRAKEDETKYSTFSFQLSDHIKKVKTDSKANQFSKFYVVESEKTPEFMAGAENDRIQRELSRIKSEPKQAIEVAKAREAIANKKANKLADKSFDGVSNTFSVPQIKITPVSSQHDVSSHNFENLKMKRDQSEDLKSGEIKKITSILNKSGGDEKNNLAQDSNPNLANLQKELCKFRKVVSDGYCRKKRNESLRRISQKYGVSLDRLINKTGQVKKKGVIELIQNFFEKNKMKVLKRVKTESVREIGGALGKAKKYATQGNIPIPESERELNDRFQMFGSGKIRSNNFHQGLLPDQNDLRRETSLAHAIRNRSPIKTFLEGDSRELGFRGMPPPPPIDKQARHSNFNNKPGGELKKRSYENWKMGQKSGNIQYSNNPRQNLGKRYIPVHQNKKPSSFNNLDDIIKKKNQKPAKIEEIYPKPLNNFQKVIEPKNLETIYQLKSEDSNWSQTNMARMRLRPSPVASNFSQDFGAMKLQPIISQQLNTLDPKPLSIERFSKDNYKTPHFFGSQKSLNTLEEMKRQFDTKSQIRIAGGFGMSPHRIHQGIGYPFGAGNFGVPPMPEYHGNEWGLGDRPQDVSLRTIGHGSSGFRGPDMHLPPGGQIGVFANSPIILPPRTNRLNIYSQVPVQQISSYSHLPNLENSQQKSHFGNFSNTGAPGKKIISQDSKSEAIVSNSHSIDIKRKNEDQSGNGKIRRMK